MPPSRQDRLDDRAMFAAVYARHGRGVYAAAMTVLRDHARAQDVVQDVFRGCGVAPRRSTRGAAESEPTCG
jgi:DNA-directed RNA polymerase specialized sigma24 family protein